MTYIPNYTLSHYRKQSPHQNFKSNSVHKRSNRHESLTLRSLGLLKNSTLISPCKGIHWSKEMWKEGEPFFTSYTGDENTFVLDSEITNWRPEISTEFLAKTQKCCTQYTDRFLSTPQTSEPLWEELLPLAGTTEIQPVNGKDKSTASTYHK